MSSFLDLGSDQMSSGHCGKSIVLLSQEGQIYGYDIPQAHILVQALAGSVWSK